MDNGAVDERIALRVLERRTELGLSLDALSELSGVSRAMISRIERAESSATASLLAKLCDGLGITLSGLMADVERPAHAFVRRAAQPAWKDPETGYVRRMLSPARTGSAVELVEVTLPPGARVTYERPPFLTYDQHVYVLAGKLLLTLGGEPLDLRPGDCVHMTLDGGAAYENRTTRDVRYLVALTTGPRPSSSATNTDRKTFAWKA